MSNHSAHIDTAKLKGLPIADFFSGAFALAQSNCCVCNTALRDAKSVELGIGPVCRKNVHYTDPANPNPNMGVVFSTVAKAKVDNLVFQYLVANKEDARMLNNILVAYSTYLMGQSRGAEIRNLTPAMRELGYNVLADKLELDRTEHKFLDLGNGIVLRTFFRTTKTAVINDLHKYLGVSPVTLKGQRGKGFLFTNAGDIEVAKYLLAKEIGGGKELFWDKGGLATLPKVETLPVPHVIASYVAPVNKNKYEYQIEFDANLGKHILRYPFPCPNVYHGLRKHYNIVPTKQAGHRYKVTVLDNQCQIDLALWLIAKEIPNQDMYYCGAVHNVQTQQALVVPSIIANPPKLPPAKIDFRVWDVTSRSVAIQTPVPWNHNWVKPLQADLKALGAKFDRNGKYWKLDKKKAQQVWALIAQHTPYTQADFV